MLAFYDAFWPPALKTRRKIDVFDENRSKSLRKRTFLVRKRVQVEVEVEVELLLLRGY